MVREADYDDEDSLTTAFEGISTLNLISYPTFVHKHRTKVRTAFGESWLLEQ